ncbi:M56 family metallopeptidase [Belliella sp. DSM 107340]|uniref:M56 family metallopeptidase n=1 Tax=Belliella calami TaxID=2923436 RepID=A0ABS9UUM3_9BACT|nr:M56 family metallopeptidase [Belliella calami]MCH7399953.1 M56 family metallopeptidase [Belliella calami]
MNEIIPANYLYAIGWMLVHSLWQIAGLGLILWLSLEFLHKKSAAFKYSASVFVLFLVIVSSIGTVLFYFEPEKESTIAYESVFVDDDKFFPSTAYSNIPQTAKSNFEILSSQIEKRIPFLVNLWFIGAILFMIKFAGSLAELRNLGQKPKKGMPERWQVTLTEFSKKLKIKHSVKIFQSNHIDTPLTFGVLKPVILIPAGLVFQLSPMQMEAIIAHELAHIKRHDYLINLLQSAMEVIFFFHPVFWYINAIIKTERENASDDAAISVGVQARDLAEALVLVVQYAKLTQPQLAMAAAKSKTPTLDRIKRIMGFHPSQKQTSTLTSLTMLTSLLLSVSLILGAHADKSINEDLELMLTEIHSEIDLGEDLWKTFDQDKNSAQNLEIEVSEELKQNLNSQHNVPDNSLNFSSKTHSGQTENVDTLKAFDLKITLSEDGKPFLFEEMSEDLKIKYFSGFDNFKIMGDTMHIWSNLQAHNSVTLSNSLNKELTNREAIINTIKITPLEFEGMDFSVMPILKLSDVMTMPHVSFDTTKVQNFNSSKIRIGYDPNQLEYQNLELTKTNSTPIKKYNSTIVKSTPAVGFYSNPISFSQTQSDTTEKYTNSIDKAILKLTNAKTEEEKETAIKELSIITNKMATMSAASKNLMEKAKNDSLFSNVRAQGELYKLKAEEMKPIIDEYQKKMIEWQKEHKPLMEEYQERMKAYEKELRPLMEEYQEKMKSFQKELQPLMNEYQQKMKEIQKEYAVKMKELQEKQVKENN